MHTDRHRDIPTSCQLHRVTTGRSERERGRGEGRVAGGGGGGGGAGSD